MHAMSGHQVLLLEHSREGSGDLDGHREWDREQRSGSTKAGSEEATVEQGKYIAKGSQQVQEGTQHDRADEEEVFGVPQAMAEEQCNALGMLTQMLVQLAEQMGALEVWEWCRDCPVSRCVELLIVVLILDSLSPCT